MNTIHPQYITDTEGNKVSVVISLAEYDQIVKQLDELNGIRHHVNTKAEKRPLIPLDEFVRQRLACGNPLPSPAHSSKSQGSALL